MRKITLPQPPSSWMELTKEQLIFIQTIPSDLPLILYKVKAFLHLAGLELCQKSFYDLDSESAVDAPLPDGDAPLSEREDRLNLMLRHLDRMQEIFDGTADMQIVLHNPKAADKRDKYLQIDSLTFFDVVNHCTKFLEDPFTLLDNKIGLVEIGEHKYKCPDPVILNLTYEQYQNASTALSSYIETARELKDCKPDSPQAPEIAERYKDAQAQFLSHVLTVMKPVSCEEEVLNPVTRRHKKVTRTYIEPKYNSAEAKRLVEELKQAPSWLFPTLYQQFQSSLIYYKDKFPKVFTDKGGEAPDPIIATVGTLNTIMKEQGYADQQAVLDANAIMNLKILDDLTRRAEEIEKMNKEIDAKKRR